MKKTQEQIDKIIDRNLKLAAIIVVITAIVQIVNIVIIIVRRITQ